MSAPAAAKKARGPKVDLDATRDRLLRLGLLHAADELEGRLTDTVKAGTSPHRMLDLLLEQELAWRDERRIRTGLRLSGLPSGQTLGNFDFGFQPAVDRSQIDTLGTCAWDPRALQPAAAGPARRREDAPGGRARRAGHRERLLRWLLSPRGAAGLDEAGYRGQPGQAAPPQVHQRRPVVIDEVGFEPMTRQEASLLFRLVSYRCGRGSILITTNKGIRDWPEVLAGDDVLATAVLDRLLHKCHVLDIKGRNSPAARARAHGAGATPTMPRVQGIRGTGYPTPARQNRAHRSLATAAFHARGRDPPGRPPSVPSPSCVRRNCVKVDVALVRETGRRLTSVVVLPHRHVAL